ncbi:MAG: hypothetical protein ACK5MZ_01285 [Aestuariibaculum sp.]
MELLKGNSEINKFKKALLVFLHKHNRMNMHRQLFLIVVLFITTPCCFSQPGPYGADLIFSIKDKSLSKKYTVFWNDTRNNTVKDLKALSGTYKVIGTKTPIGGGFTGYITLVHKKDTMFVHPPTSMYEDIVLKIPFRKGTYSIPNLVYETQALFKPEYRERLAINLEADWSEFEIKQKLKLPTVTLRRIEIIENSRLFTNIYPRCHDATNIYSSSPYHLKDYFEEDGFYEKIICNNFYIPRNYKYFFFGVLKKTNLYFLQREEDSPIEYGTLQIPIDRSVQQKQENCHKGLLFPNLADDVYFSTESLIGGNIPIVFGYYHAVKKCDESFGSVKETWGMFNIYINKPDEKTLDIIEKEHSYDNNLIENE